MLVFGPRQPKTIVRKRENGHQKGSKKDTPKIENSGPVVMEVGALASRTTGCWRCASFGELG